VSGPRILVVEDDAPTRHAVASTLAASETLAANGQALRPSACTFCTVSAQNSSFKSTQAMSAPAAASFRAMAWPIPRPAPVTTAT